VALLHANGQGRAFFGQCDRLIGSRFHQAFVLQSSHRPRNRHVADGKKFGQIADTTLVFLGKDIIDGFDVVLRRFIGVLTAGAGERVRSL